MNIQDRVLFKIFQVEIIFRSKILMPKIQIYNNVKIPNVPVV